MPRPGLMALAVLLAMVPAEVAQSQPLAGKQVSMVIGFGPGGGYDLWARTVGQDLCDTQGDR